jgi:predicted DCC family thiol-disulfide oxidoreductase YuxK
MSDTRAMRQIILFDGVCNLCNGWVNFVIDRDPRGRFAFAPLQSEAADRLLKDRGYARAPMASIVLVDRERVYDRSSAVLRILRGLSGAWPWLHGLVLIPRPIRDLLYDWVAQNRYRWFGREASCRIPTPDLRARFIAWE